MDPDKGLNGLITYSLLDLMPPGYVQLEDSSAGKAGRQVCLLLSQRDHGPLLTLQLWPHRGPSMGWARANMANVPARCPN